MELEQVLAQLDLNLGELVLQTETFKKCFRVDKYEVDVNVQYELIEERMEDSQQPNPFLYEESQRDYSFDERGGNTGADFVQQDIDLQLSQQKYKDNNNGEEDLDRSLEDSLNEGYANGPEREGHSVREVSQLDEESRARQPRFSGNSAGRLMTPENRRRGP